MPFRGHASCSKGRSVQRLEIVTVVLHTTSKADALISPRLRSYIRTPMGLLIFDQMWVQ
jgi:hypothetical protein